MIIALVNYGRKTYLAEDLHKIMKRIYIICEGQTEETFINEVLQPYFLHKNLYLYPILLGGGNTYGRIKKIIDIKCKNDKNAFITSMIDLYGLPPDFPYLDTIKNEKNPLQKVTIAENAFKHDINQPNFIPNIILHEFEALLFSDTQPFSKWFCAKNIKNLAQDIYGQNPEEINDSVQTAPSKRILKYLKNYDKPLHGSLIAIDIGLDIIRQQCPHFNAWLKKLENI